MRPILHEFVGGWAVVDDLFTCVAIYYLQNDLTWSIKENLMTKEEAEELLERYNKVSK